MISIDSLARIVASAPAVSGPATSGAFDMHAFLSKTGLTLLREKPWSSHAGGTVYELKQCPFDSGHVNGSAVLTLLNGQPGFKCQHSTCSGKGISEVFAKYSVRGKRKTDFTYSDRSPKTECSLETPLPSRGEQPDRPEQAFGSFRITDHGVFLVKDCPGGSSDLVKLAARVDVIAETRDSAGNNWGRLLRWQDNEGREHRWAMPMEVLSSDAAGVRARLLGEGLAFISTNARWRERFAEYLQTAPVNRRIRCISRGGWHDSSYTLPDETFGLEGSDEVMYQASTDADSNWRIKGSANDWRVQIGEKCSGNSRLVLAVSCAFAGPLLSIAGAESGGIHFYGASSTGKSTALLVGGSVCGGGPVGFVQNWRATVNGLESLAEAFNDGTLYLDELAQVDPKEAAEACYLLANGQGKSRMTKALTFRKKLTWRILFVSAGELTLAEHAASAGKQTKGGAEVRLLNICADAGQGLGLFENLHEFPSPEGFVSHLRAAANNFYGAPFRSYLATLVGSRKSALEVIEAAKSEVRLTLPPNAAGEVVRAADRFALVGAAGELATKWGLTGWEKGESIQAITQCLHAWIAARGTLGNSDLEAGIIQVRAFLGKHGSSRFQRLLSNPRTNRNEEEVVRDRVGFYRSDENDETEFLILLDVFRGEVCAGRDFTGVAKELHKRGFLVRDGQNLTIKPRLPGLGSVRVYCVRSAILEGTNVELP